MNKTNSNHPKLNFNHLPGYADFLLRNRLNDFVLNMISISKEEKISFLKYFENLQEEDLVELSLKKTKKLFKYFTQNKTEDFINIVVKRWADMHLNSLQKEQMLALDIAKFTFLLRKNFRDFLPQYTSDLSTYTSIIEEVERFTAELEETGIKAMFPIVQKKINSSKLKEGSQLDLDEKYLKEIKDMVGFGTFEWRFGVDHSLNSPQLLNFFELNDSNKLESFLENIHPSDRKKLKEARDKSLKDSENYECTYRFQKIHNEKIIWSHGNLVFSNGIPVKMIGSIMDVAQNYNLSQQLKESEKTFRHLIQHAPDAVILIDESSKILLWNPKAEEIFGWTADEIVGKTLLETLISPQYKQAYIQGIKRATVLNKTIETVAVNKKGKEFFIALSIAGSYHKGKHAFISFIRDISKEKQIERELEQHRDQMAQKNIELEKINTELSSFSYVASHDLKEPLRKIKTYSNFIIEKSKDNVSEDVKYYLDRIIVSTSNMQKLIDDLLTFSKTASAEKKLETLDLNVLLEEVENSLKETIDEKNVTITSTHLPTLKVIPFQFHQLLENLISNAIKYSKTDLKPHISIISGLVPGKLYKKDGADINKNYHKISLVDNGIGFEKIYTQKIFEIFQRLHGKNEYSGTGIGLAICKKIVENHKGFITAQSEKGEGSIFNIFIPLR